MEWKQQWYGIDTGLIWNQDTWHGWERRHSHSHSPVSRFTFPLSKFPKSTFSSTFPSTTYKQWTSGNETKFVNGNRQNPPLNRCNSVLEHPTSKLEGLGTRLRTSYEAQTSILDSFWDELFILCSFNFLPNLRKHYGLYIDHGVFFKLDKKLKLLEMNNSSPAQLREPPL